MALSFLLYCSNVVAPSALSSGTDGQRVTSDHRVYNYIDAHGPTNATFFFENSGPQTAYFADLAPIEIDDGASWVFSPQSIQQIVAIPPGSIYTLHWNFHTNCYQNLIKDANCAGIALPGPYELRWFYSVTSPANPMLELNANFSILEVPP